MSAGNIEHAVVSGCPATPSYPANDPLELRQDSFSASRAAGAMVTRLMPNRRVGLVFVVQAGPNGGFDRWDCC